MSASAVLGAAATALGYLAGLEGDYSNIDWSVVANWLGGFGITGAGIGWLTSAKQEDKTAVNWTSGFRFSARSITNLSGVEPVLVEIAERALQLSTIDFAITSGLRTLEEQAELKRRGKTPILHSRHLYGYAVDVMAWVDGKESWDIEHYKIIAKAFEQAAAERGVLLNWGGDWKSVDGPHFELSKIQYPDKVIDLAELAA
jgi:hypothetical protein